MPRSSPRAEYLEVSLINFVKGMILPMKEQLNKIKSDAEGALLSANTLESVEELRVRFLGKKGELTAVSKGVGQLSAEERPVIGQLAKEVRWVMYGSVLHLNLILYSFFRIHGGKPPFSHSAHTYGPVLNIT